MARIGIDIDDTITDSSSVIKQYIEKYDDNYSDSHILKTRIDTIIRGFFDHEVIVKFFMDYAKEIMLKVKIRDNAKEVIQKLKQEGHEIIIITARTDNYYGDATKFCKEYLNKQGIVYDKVITGQIYKVETCKRENIDIMVDDGVDTCDDLNKNGIKALLYSTEINEDRQTISQRVNTWLETYDKINEFLNK